MSKVKKQCTYEQKKLLVDFMLSHKKLATGKLSGNNFRTKVVKFYLHCENLLCFYFDRQLYCRHAFSKIINKNFSKLLFASVFYKKYIKNNLQNELYDRLTLSLNAVKNGAVKNEENWKRVRIIYFIYSFYLYKI